MQLTSNVGGGPDDLRVVRIVCLDQLGGAVDLLHLAIVNLLLVQRGIDSWKLVKKGERVQVHQRIAVLPLQSLFDRVGCFDGRSLYIRLLADPFRPELQILR